MSPKGVEGGAEEQLLWLLANEGATSSAQALMGSTERKSAGTPLFPPDMCVGGGTPRSKLPKLGSSGNTSIDSTVTPTPK